MINKPTIAVDIDEVLFPMAPTLLRYHNEKYRTKFSLSQLTTYRLEDLTGETTEEVQAKIKSYLSTNHHLLGEPTTGSIDAIRKLREKYRLTLVTSRDPFFRGYTEQFLETNFAGLYDKLIYTHDVDKLNIRVPKYKICQVERAIALVDDSLSNVIDCAKHGMQGVLFGDYPWNATEELPTGVVRVNNWQEVLEFFNGRYK